MLLAPVSGGEGRAIIGRNIPVAPNGTVVLSSGSNNGKEISGYHYVAGRLRHNVDIVIDDEV